MPISISSEKLVRLNNHLAAIGQQLQHYYVQLTSGTATGTLHFSVYAHQLCQWSLTITTLLSDSTTLADLQAMYPYWTTPRLQGILDSLQKIKSYMAKHVDQFHHNGAWRTKDAKGLCLSKSETATLASLIGVELTQ